jgi:hypothetical protein
MSVQLGVTPALAATWNWIVVLIESMGASGVVTDFWVRP